MIDWAHPANNDFLLVHQFNVTSALYSCRQDLVGLVNGLPLVVSELKKPDVPARAAFVENLTRYKQQIPALVWFNALLIASNGTDGLVGSLTADSERFFVGKRIDPEDEPRHVSLEVMLRGTCDRARLLDLVENFTLKYKVRRSRWVRRLVGNGIRNLIAETRAECAGKLQAQKVEEQLGYFVHNLERMQYRTFRRQSLFIGSGVMEAGCKTLIGSRCKQSSMFWRTPGAVNILALCCIHASRCRDQFWRESLNAQAAPNECLTLAA